LLDKDIHNFLVLCVLGQIGQNTIATIGSTAKIIPDTKTAPWIKS